MTFTEIVSSLQIIQGNAAVPLTQELDAAVTLALGEAKRGGTTSQVALKLSFEVDSDGQVHIDHAHSAKSAAKLTEAKGASLFMLEADGTLSAGAAQ